MCLFHKLIDYLLSPVQIKKLVWTTSSGKTVTHTMPEGRASRPVTSEARIPARRRLWDKYEFSSDEEENEDGDDTRFHELNQNSEDSRHFYVPPLNHEGLIMRPESGAKGVPIHFRTTKATEEAHKNPSIYMREIKGALDDLKLLSKMKILSPRGSSRPRSSTNSPRNGI